MRDAPISDALLAWYDENHRTMPWRTGPRMIAQGARPDPYHVWLSEIMLQQTTVATVTDYFRKFVTLWPTVNDLAAAHQDEVLAAWAGLGYYARARNLVKCARIVSRELNGRFPEDIKGLLALPGVGTYTASAIAAIAYDQAETVVDGNVERVIARLHAVRQPLPAAKQQLAKLAAQHTPKTRPGDYAQAIMDLGATLCKPRSPDCTRCPVSAQCRGRAENIHEALPAKTPKKPKPVRQGIVYVAKSDDGHWLLERRVEAGLLGGMLGWPGTDWGDAAQASPPLDANWRAADRRVTHTFTHFHLDLQVMVAQVRSGTPSRQGKFIHPKDFDPGDLPTVMRKVYDVAAPVLETT